VVENDLRHYTLNLIVYFAEDAFFFFPHLCPHSLVTKERTICPVPIPEVTFRLSPELALLVANDGACSISRSLFLGPNDPYCGVGELNVTTLNRFQLSRPPLPPNTLLCEDRMIVL